MNQPSSVQAVAGEEHGPGGRDDALVGEARALHIEILQRTGESVGGRAVDPAFSLLGCGSAGIPPALAALERTTQRSVRNMQRRVVFEPRNPYAVIDVRSRARGVTLELIVAPSAVRSNPMLSSMAPHTRMAFVAMPLLIIDDSLVVVPGPMNDLGEATAWLARENELVAKARALWDRTWALSTPIVPDGRPPLTERQYAVACMVADGATDGQIARRLHISPRTVCNDITAARRLVNASSRSGLIAKLMTYQL